MAREPEVSVECVDKLIQAAIQFEYLLCRYDDHIMHCRLANHAALV